MDSNALRERLSVIDRLVEVGALNKSLDEKLIEFLNVLLNVSFLRLLPKGLFMIAERRLDASSGLFLRMMAQVGVADQLRISCSTVSFGHCLCGLAAEKQKVVVRCQLDRDHHIQYDGMVDHGHIILPLVSYSELFGVLCLYTACQYVPSEDELDFLKTVATTAASFVHHQMDKNRLARTAIDLEVMWRKSSEAHYLVTVDGSIEDVNNAFLGMFGIDKNEIADTNIRDLYWNPEDRKKATTILMEVGVLRQHEVWFRHHKTGEKIIGLISAQVRHDDAGNVIGYVGIIFDMTITRMLEI